MGQSCMPVIGVERSVVKSDYSRAWLVMVVLLAVALRMGRCATAEGLGRARPITYTEYTVAAQHLLEQGAFVSPLVRDIVPEEPSALMPPVYVALVAGVYGVLGVGTFAATLALQVINALATSLAVPLAFHVTRRIADRRGGWIAALLVAFNPTLVGYTNYMWDTSVFTLAVIVSVWMACRLGERSALWWEWLAFGFWLGLVALLNPALTLAYPLLVLWPATKFGGWRLRSTVNPACLTVCGWLVAIAPWTVRNYVELGEFMYIRNGFPLQLWLGVCPEAEEHGAAVFASQFPLMNDEAQRRVSAIGEQAYLEECREQAMAAIAAEPVRYLKLVTIRILDFFAGTTYSHAPPEGGGWPKRPSRAVAMLFVLLETLVILIYLVGRRRAGPDLLWLLAIIVAFSVVYCLTHVQLRFRSPIEPLIAVVLGVMLTDVHCTWARWRRGRANARLQS